MKRILVPIDNSRVSKGAVIYAVGLAADLGGEVILLSVLNASSTSSTLINWRIIEHEMVKNEREVVARLLADIRKTVKTKVRISHKYVLGFPIHEMINRFASENKIDMIVMGTSGARGLKKVLAGTNSAAVIDASSVPVITVPGTKVSKHIKRIIYATDMVRLDDEIKLIAKFAKPLDAAIEIVYLTPDGGKKRNRSELERILITMSKYSKIRLNVAKGKDIADSLRVFASTHKADLIVMFTHELDFFERLFGRGRTRQVVFNSPVPLLAFNRTNSQL